MDFVFALGKGSKWDNNELRYTLRAIEKNANGYGKIVIVGEKPHWIKNVLHIPFPDIFKSGMNGNADGNMVLKVMAAVYHPNVSEDFIYINDDELFLVPQDVKRLGWYHKGQMLNFRNETWTKGFWRLRLHRTMRILVDKGLDTYHYDNHLPFRMNKKKFLECMSSFDFGENIGYTINSMYGNFNKVAGTKIVGHKIRVFSKFSKEKLEAGIPGKLYMTFNDNGLNDVLINWLSKNFPTPSQYEATQSGIDKAPIDTGQNLASTAIGYKFKKLFNP
jgi:hypothetical protein